MLILLSLLPVGMLLGERWLGRRALESCKRQLETRGEVFAAEHLWRPVSHESIAFSTQLAGITRQLPEKFKTYAGQLASSVVEGPGTARRGSQEHEPPMTRKDAPADGWRHLNALLEEGQAPMRSLRELMKDPPAEIDYDVSRLLQDGYSNFVGFRAGAQALHAAAINDLHRGDMVQAMENLQALSAFSRHPARAGELSQISAGKEKGLAS